ncbi:MAG: diacylglycerol kinase family protein [Anaerolineae bacterium]
MADSQEVSSIRTLPFKKLCVIINPAAGIDRPILGIINNAFKDTDAFWDVRITHKAGDAQRLAKEAVAQGFDVVAAHGGDGTVMEVAYGLYGTDVPLAIFPGGTANVMAAELGVSSDLNLAVGLVGSGDYDVRKIDIGTAGEHKFILRIGIGFEADMMKNADQEMKNRFGLLAYVFSAFNEILNPAPVTYKLTLDGQQYEAEGVSCMIANSGNVAIGGLRLSRKIEVSDGLLDVVVFRSVDIGSIISVTTTVLAQAEATELPQIQHWQCHEAIVEAVPPQTVSVDGEIIEQNPISARVLSQAVNVIVPKTTAS